MTDPEVQVDVGRIDGARGRSGLRSGAVLLVVPVTILAIVAFAVLGDRPGGADDLGTGAATPTAARTTAPAPPTTPVPTPTAVATPTAAPSLATTRPVDLSIAIPPGPVLLDVTHRALPSATPGLVGSNRATLAPGTTYTLLARCAGPGSVKWPAIGDSPAATFMGTVPCDATAHQALLPVDRSVGASIDVGFAYDLAADVHLVVVKLRKGVVAPEPLAIPLGADGSRPAFLGDPTDAITVDEIRGVDVVAGLAVRRMTLNGQATVLSVIPASAFPPDARPVLFEGSATISPAGYLAVPFEREGDPDDTEFAAVFDLTYPLATAAEVGDRGEGFSWSPDGGLAAYDGDGLAIYSPATGARSDITLPPQVELGSPIAWTVGGQLVAYRTVNQRIEPGVLRLDGSFEAGVPTLTFDPRGGERQRAADGRTLGDACDDGPTGGGCYLIVTDATGRHPRVWNAGLDLSGIPAAIWGEDGRSVWMLDTGRRRPRLIHSSTPTTGSVVAVFPVADGSYQSPRIAGASVADRAIAIDPGNGRTVIYDTTTGVHVGLEGWFAGWADTRGSVYPNPDAG